MDTSGLKQFAVAVRVQLIREVFARVGVVMLPGSTARVETPAALAALVRAVDAAGGGDLGRSAVADRVAYTWFNRVIALRFMDANGFTGVGVVSPQADRVGGQPEVLAQAVGGHIDSAVVDARAAARITGLLNGTLRSADAHGEAYGLLLAAYCRRWNESMPFMFEREGDYTELLIPSDLLSDESVLAKAVSVLTPEVCQDVEVIGWLYQFYISERKDEVFAGFKKNQKAGPAEIPAATQLFTPHWIVRYLVENSLGRLWLLNHPASDLAAQMEYYIAPVDVETDFLKVTSPEELKVMDPACGSGHMLTYAFDLLYAIYEEEGYSPADIPSLILQHNLFGTEIDQRAGALAAFALTMKARAKQKSFFGKAIQPNICVLEPISFTVEELDDLVTPGGHRVDEEAFFNQFADADTFGSLIRPDETLIAPLKTHLALNPSDSIYGAEAHERAERVVAQAEYLSQRYHVVVANPPYMGSGNMGLKLANWARKNFPNSKTDLFAMFMERNYELVGARGLLGMITMQSWMFLSSFADLRESLLKNHTIRSMAHLGTNAFDSIGGEVVSTTAFVLETRCVRNPEGIYLRLVDGRSEVAKENALRAARDPDCEWRYTVSAEDLLGIPGSPISYWLRPTERAAFQQGRRLGDVVSVREGINTADNNRFLRFWWEVAYRHIDFEAHVGETAVGKWIPLKKGGSYRKWFGNQDYVLNWENDGEEIRSFTGLDGKVRSRPQNTQFFYEKSLSWGRISSGDFSMRAYGTGFAFDSTGPSAFGSEADLDFVLAFLNSSVANRFLRAISPTLDYRLTNLGNLPIAHGYLDHPRVHVRELVQASAADWSRAETAWQFAGYSLGGSSVRPPVLAELWNLVREQWRVEVERSRELERHNNTSMAELYSLTGDIDADVPLSRVSLSINPDFRFAHVATPEGREALLLERAVKDLISHGVGCVFGRYSAEQSGLALANPGDTLQDFLAQVPDPSFMPDADNVVPIIDGEWFEDDIVSRFRQFLRVMYGDAHFEENLRFIEDALGKDLRKYFVTDFYSDHVQRYKKRPIYWMFSSPKGSFNALIYMHRYNPSTVGTVLNDYLREFQEKLKAELANQERISAAASNARDKARADKETDRIRKVLLELDVYEHDVLWPLATQQIEIDLDDGVKANYPKFGTALKKISGLESADE